MARPLTDQEIAREREFMKGLPRINWGAFFMPPIWGPAHGLWITILFYPAWLFADNIFYEAAENPTVLSVTLGVIVFAVMLGVTIAFAIASQPFAAHRAESLGISRDTYLRRERWWALASIALGIVFLVFASYYNIAIRPVIPVEGAL